MINQLVLFAKKIERALVHGILKKHLVAACRLTNSNLPGLVVMPKLFVTLWRRKKQLFLSPFKDCLVKDSPVKDSFTQDLQEVITNHQCIYRRNYRSTTKFKERHTKEEYRNCRYSAGRATRKNWLSIRVGYNSNKRPNN